MAKTWQEKHDGHKHPAHLETLEKPFAGLSKGTIIVIATPREISDYFRSIPRGRTRSLEQLRAAIARRHGADAACPLTTGIFCRIAAEHAYERFRQGARSVAPFWRAIDPASPLAKKLSCGPDFIRERRAAEGIAPASPSTPKRAAPHRRP